MSPRHVTMLLADPAILRAAARKQTQLYNQADIWELDQTSERHFECQATAPRRRAE